MERNLYGLQICTLSCVIPNAYVFIHLRRTEDSATVCHEMLDIDLRKKTRNPTKSEMKEINTHVDAQKVYIS